MDIAGSFKKEDITIVNNNTLIILVDCKSVGRRIEGDANSRLFFQTPEK